MLKKVLYSAIASIIFMMSFTSGAAEKLSLSELQNAEFKFWKFFAEIDSISTYNVIKKYFKQNSQEEKLKGLNDIVNLIKEKVTDEGFLSISSLIRYDEEFLNTLIWEVDDINFKKYALQYIIPIDYIPLDEMALLRTHVKVIDNDSLVVKIFKKYSISSDLEEDDYDLMITALIIAQENKILSKDISTIKNIVENSSWAEKARIQQVIEDIQQNKIDKTNYIVKNYILAEFPFFKYEHDVPFGELSKFLALYDKTQQEGLHNIVFGNAEAFNDLFLKLDIKYLKQVILFISASRLAGEVPEGFVVSLLNVYKDKNSLTEDEFDLIWDILLEYRVKGTNDKVVEVLKSSNWIKLAKRDKEGKSKALNTLWFLDTEGSDVRAYLKMIMDLPMSRDISYDVWRVEPYLNEKSDDDYFNLQEVILDIFDGYKDVQILNVFDYRLLLKTVDSVYTTKDIRFAKKVLDVVDETGLKIKIDRSPVNDYAIGLIVKFAELSYFVNGKKSFPDDCAKKFMDE